MPTSARRLILAVTVLAGACALPGCGLDPPPAAGADPAPQVAEVPVQAGTALAPRTDLTEAKENGSSARCNIEMLSGQALEAVHPTIGAGPAVNVQGWYATAQVTAKDDAAAATTTDVPADGAVPVAAAGITPMLVISSENGVKLWTVALPEFSERRDVAKALDDPSLARSGFNFTMDLRELKPGFYGLHLSDGGHSAASVCGLGRGFIIK